MPKKMVYDKFTKRLEKQMYLAKESPEPVYDVSACNLTEVPKAVFSYCKILQKETLLLYENKLNHLKDGLSDLYTIKFLDLHSNLLTSISRDFSLLTSLRHLDLSHNYLSNLPSELASLKHLQKLLINNNAFKSFPVAISNITSLHHLDISHNHIKSLPKQLHNLRSLTFLNLDAHVITYPDKRICSEGLVSIMKFLCAESNVKYEPVLNGDDDDVDSSATTLSTSLPHSPLNPSKPLLSSLNNFASNSESNLDVVLLDYELLREKRRQERMELERRMLQDQQQQALIATQAASNKKMMMHLLAEEHNRFNDEICSVQKKKTVERSHLIRSLQAVEENAASLVERFVRTNEQARRTEELMDKMEKERLERDQWYIVKKEEFDNLRRKDIAESFERMLGDADVMGELIKKYVNKKQQSITHSIHQMSEKDGVLDEKFNSIKDDKRLLIGKLLNEERMQKKAFEMLQYERDSCHARVASQIRMVEEQLLQLTILELDKRASQLDNHLNLLEDNRTMLTRLLRQLLAEREKREGELKKRLLEMEERSNTRQLNYWLVQYQRLLDSKPRHFLKEMKGLDSGVLEVLERAGAGEFKVIFGHKGVTMEALMDFSEADLRALGVSDDVARAQILSVVQFSKNQKLTQAQPQASAPEPVEQATSQSQLNTECVICLSQTSDVLFLNCGHICTCQPCSQPLTHCPMDRAKIERKIKIYVTA